MKAYIARQPILDERQAVYGYELLYKDSKVEPYRKENDATNAICSILSDAIATLRLEKLVNGKKALISFTRPLLFSDVPYLFTPEDFIIQVPAGVLADDGLLNRLKKLQKDQYVFALEGYAGQEGAQPLVELCGLIKVDFSLASSGFRKRFGAQYSQNKLLLAQRVESEQEDREAVESGYRLFQGDFYSRPMLTEYDAMLIAPVTYKNIWKELSKPIPSFDNLAEYIRRDMHLYYKLLQHIDSRDYKGGHIYSVKQMLVYLGVREVRRWFTLIQLHDAIGHRQDERFHTAAVRGVFAEKLVTALKKEEYREAAYRLGLLSMLQPEAQKELPQLIGRLPNETLACEALQGKQNLLTEVLAFVLHYERGEWDSLPAFLQKYQLDSEDVGNFYLQAVHYADAAFLDCRMDQ